MTGDIEETRKDGQEQEDALSTYTSVSSAAGGSADWTFVSFFRG